MEERISRLTSELVAIPTHEEEIKAQELLASWLEPIGFDCDLQEIEPGRANLLARRGTGGPFLCSHVDTHRPHAHPEPLLSRRQGDLLIGRGVLDAKGQIAAMVAALEAEADADVCVLITCDEEGGGLGSERARIPDGPWFSTGGVVLEPTDLEICTAQTGHVDVRVEVSAPSTHAYAPQRAGSPIRAVLAVIEELDTCRFLKIEHPLLGRPKTNIGRLRAGEDTWRTPSRARLELTLGVVPPTPTDEAEAEVRSRLDDLARRWTERGTSFLYEICDRSQPVEVDPGLEVAKLLASALGEPLTAAGMPSWTDAGNLLEHHGLPCVVFGAGELASAHSNQEWVRTADLARLAEVLRTLLRSSAQEFLKSSVIPE